MDIGALLICTSRDSVGLVLAELVWLDTVAAWLLAEEILEELEVLVELAVVAKLVAFAFPLNFQCCRCISHSYDNAM